MDSRQRGCKWAWDETWDDTTEAETPGTWQEASQ